MSGSRRCPDRRAVHTASRGRDRRRRIRLRARGRRLGQGSAIRHRHHRRRRRDRCEYGTSIAARSTTRCIEDGVKLDNLVQIAHNVRVGAHTVMAAMSGTAGSTRIGRRCMIGGRVVMINHLRSATTSCSRSAAWLRSRSTSQVCIPGSCRPRKRVLGGAMPFVSEGSIRWRSGCGRRARCECGPNKGEEK